MEDLLQQSVELLEVEVVVLEHREGAQGQEEDQELVELGMERRELVE